MFLSWLQHALKPWAEIDPDKLNQTASTATNSNILIIIIIFFFF